MIEIIKENDSSIYYKEDGYLLKHVFWDITYHYCKCHQKGYHADDGPAIEYAIQNHIMTNLGFKSPLVNEYWTHGKINYVILADGSRWYHYFKYNNEDVLGKWISASCDEEFEKILKLKAFW